MKNTYSRRAFGCLAFGASIALQTLPAFASDPGYANPGLLVDPDALAKRLGIALPAGSTKSEDIPLVIDVRPHSDYQAGHIPGAVWLDPNAVVAEHSPVSGALMDLGEIAALLGTLGMSSDRQTVFYDDRGGFHAARMFWLMEYLGHSQVALLNGGLTSWLASGGALEQQSAVQAARLFQPAVSPRRYASAEDVLRHRSEENAVLIDVRPPQMFEEGHIPWAINVPWVANLTEDKRFKSADNLSRHFHMHNVSTASNVIMHCQNGLASSHSYVALRLLGLSRVRVYHRSWAEWGSDTSLPKAVG